MIEAYKRVVLRNYANFSGRATRPEYWWFTLANLIVMVAVFFLAFLRMSVIGGGSFASVVGYASIYYIAILLPSLAVTVRRLHDIDKSAWWLLFGLIPSIGVIIFLILMAQKTYPRPNKCGNPEGWQNAVSA